MTPVVANMSLYKHVLCPQKQVAVWMPPSARLPWDAALQGHFPGWAAPPAALPIPAGTCTLK